MEVQSSLFYSRKVVVTGSFSSSGKPPVTADSTLLPQTNFQDGGQGAKGLAKLIERIGPAATDGVSLSAAPALNITAREILEKINQKLSRDFRSGEAPKSAVADNRPTPEQSARFVLDGIKLLYTRFKETNPKLDEETLLNEFFSRVREGVEQGYGEGVKILEENGLLKNDENKERVVKLKGLIDEGVSAFEKSLRESLGVSGQVAELASGAVNQVASGTESENGNDNKVLSLVA